MLTIIPAALAQPPVCDWRGYVHVNGSLANTSHIVTSYTNGTSATNGTIYSDGYYILHIPGSSGDNITFYVCGVLAYPTNESTTYWSCGGVGYNELNLTMHTLPDGSSCTYNCGCSGGLCCSGICYSNACPVTATTTAAPGPGGGVPSATTTPTQTPTPAVTTVPVTTTTVPVVEINKLEKIEAGENATVSINKSEELKIEEMKIEAVNNVQITVTRTDLVSANIAIAAPGLVYTYLNVEKTNIQDEDINKVNIKFKVEKSWVDENRIDILTIKLRRYADDVWSDLPTALVGEDDIYYHFDAESPGLSVFAISGEKLPEIAPEITTIKPPTTTTTAKPYKPTPLQKTRQYWYLVIIALLIVGIGIVWGAKLFS